MKFTGLLVVVLRWLGVFGFCVVLQFCGVWSGWTLRGLCLLEISFGLVIFVVLLVCILVHFGFVFVNLGWNLSVVLVLV